MFHNDFRFKGDLLCSSSHFKILPYYASRMVLHDAFERSPFHDDKPNLNRPYDPQREAKFLLALKDIVQNPEPSLIWYGNLDCLPHRTTRKGSYINSQIAAITWDRLEDFVQREQQNSNFPCKFNGRGQWRNNPARMLAFPRACSPSQIVL